MAFGPAYAMEGPVREALRGWQEHCKPKVDLFVTSSMATPFLVNEANKEGAINGPRVARTELAGAMAKAHDILCSLGIPDGLYVLGIVQNGEFITTYASCSKRKVVETHQVVLCGSIRSTWCATAPSNLFRFKSCTLTVLKFPNLKVL